MIDSSSMLQNSRAHQKSLSICPVLIRGAPASNKVREGHAHPQTHSMASFIAFHDVAVDYCIHERILLSFRNLCNLNCKYNLLS